MVWGLQNGLNKFHHKFKLSGSAGLNIWNKNSVLILSKLFDTLTPSAELSKEDLRTVIWDSRLDGMKKRFELVVQGNVDTLISKDCLLSIVSEKDNVESVLGNSRWEKTNLSH